MDRDPRIGFGWTFFRPHAITLRPKPKTSGTPITNPMTITRTGVETGRTKASVASNSMVMTAAT